MRPALRVLGLGIFALSTLTIPCSASTVAPPSNLGELARASKSVVFAQAVDSSNEMKGGIPWTVTRFQVLDEVAGAKVGREIEVEEIGAAVDGVGLVVSGAPKFEAGGRYLLFLDSSASGRWRPKMLSYGLLRETDASGILRPLKEAGELQVLSRPGVEAVGEYRETELLQHLKSVAAGAPWLRKAVEAPALKAAATSPSSQDAPLSFVGAELNAPAECAYLRSNAGNLPVRWFGFESGTTVDVFHTTPGQIGIADGGVSAVQEGIAAWVNDPNSVIKLNYGGSRARTASCADNDARDRFINEVVFNDPCGQIPALAACSDGSGVCCGTVALGGVFHDSTQTRSYNGENWRPAESLFVVVNDGSQCLGDTDFKEMVTHNLGHGLAFDHHNDTNATMFGQLGVHASRGAALAATDLRCADYAYHTFVDVPADYWAWSWIEAIENAAVTGGCGAGNYCPDQSILRQTMAVFLLVAMEGAGYTPPACTTPVFNDVPCSNPFAAWINELSVRGVVAGCGNGNYCPTNPVTREQMSVFLLKTKEGFSYNPPPCTTQSFNDVSCSNPFSAWINELVNRHITAGCSAGQYCPGNPVTRAQMAVFLSANFGLTVPTLP
ncbi:MAG TPA: S-layer homology domain-containing protein [Thermoanaerobaculia bacterium]|jgi:hypothetical protein|nr:S-layer homology domain-containing protein [Thermoanaerobaculia bacterium]